MSDIYNEGAGYCGVCGFFISDKREIHKCDPNVLRGIDAANTRAWKELLYPDLNNNYVDFWITEHERLEQGFSMLSDEFED